MLGGVEIRIEKLFPLLPIYRDQYLGGLGKQLLVRKKGVIFPIYPMNLAVRYSYFSWILRFLQPGYCNSRKDLGTQKKLVGGERAQKRTKIVKNRFTGYQIFCSYCTSFNISSTRSVSSLKRFLSRYRVRKVLAPNRNRRIPRVSRPPLKMRSTATDAPGIAR